MKIFILGLMLALSGCFAIAGRFDDSQLAGLKARTIRATASTGVDVALTDVDCASLDEKRALWTMVAQVSGGLAAGSGLIAIPTNDDTARIALAVSAIIFGGGAVGAGMLTSDYSNQWVKNCQTVQVLHLVPAPESSSK